MIYMNRSPRGAGPPGYSETMPRTPETAQRVRGLTRTVMCVWRIEEDDAVLVMSELFANAVRHATGSVVRVIINRPDPDRVYLAVVDREPHQVPLLRDALPGDIHGRGLALIDDLSDCWGYDLMGRVQRRWGKKVWAKMKTGAA